MNITTEKATSLGMIYFKVFLDGEYIGFGWNEQDAIDFGARYIAGR